MTPPDTVTKTPDAPTTTEACLLREHDLFFLFDFPCVRATHLPTIDALTIAGVDAGGALGIVHETRRAGELAERRLFEPATLNLSRDLHPAARAVLADDKSPEAPIALPCRRLSDHGLRLLNGEWARPPGDPRQQPGFVPGRGLAVRLDRGGRDRIAAAGGTAADFLRLEVKALHLLSFQSNIGMAALRLQVMPDPDVRLGHVQEALHVLSNASRARSIGWASEAVPAGRFTLSELLDGVLEAAQCRGTPWNRLFTYAYAQLAERPACDTEMDLAAWRLSRHYTSSYHPGGDYLLGTTLARPFHNVTHAASLEGVASLTAGDSAFMRDGFAARVGRSYLPLTVLGFHEHVQLLEMTRRAAGALVATERSGSTAPERGRARAVALRLLSEDFLSFRLRYRLALVSDIGMHNLFYGAVRSGLGLDVLERKLAGDTADASRALQTREARQIRDEHRLRERRRAWILGLFAGQLTFLATLTFLRELRELFSHVRETPEWLPAMGAAAFALFSGWFAARRHADAHEGEEDEVGREIMADLEDEAVQSASEKK